LGGRKKHSESDRGGRVSHRGWRKGWGHKKEEEGGNATLVQNEGKIESRYRQTEVEGRYGKKKGVFKKQEEISFMAFQEEKVLSELKD